MERPAEAEKGYQMAGVPASSRPRPERSDRRWLIAGGLALLLGSAGAATFLILSNPSPIPSTPATEVAVTPNTGEKPFTVSPEFWGGNLGTSSPVSGTFTGEAAATPVNYYRWPGGQAGDGINYTTGTLYNASNGSPGNVTTNLTTFVAWCETIGCHAVLELPAEIDAPNTAAYYVAYTEKVLRFFPAYWEIGNEPALWTHFGIPWSQWSAQQNVNATPASYAQVVRLYDLAIRSVDPSTSIIGLGGVGTGSFQEIAWIKATVAVNRMNLSAVAIHVYPAGIPPNGTATVQGFYANLTGGRSLSDRVPADRAAILAACVTCTQIKLLVTEYGSASAVGSYTEFEEGFDQVPFIAHEVAEGLDLGVTGMYLRQVVTPHSGSWYDSSGGTTHPLFDLYSLVLPLLGAEVIPIQVAPKDPSLAVVATQASPSGSMAVLLVNANATTGARVHLHSPLANPGSATLESWNDSDAAPTPVSVVLNGSPSVLLPPLSLAVVVSGPPPANATLVAPVPAPAALSGGSVDAGPAARPRE